MKKEVNKNIDKTNATKAYIHEIRGQIIDNQASELFKHLKWIKLDGISPNKSELFDQVFGY